MHSKEQKRKIKVGFDLDGVILYNPLRAVRPFLKFIRKYLLKKKSTGSYVPKTKAEELMSYMYIKLSLFVSPGFADIAKLMKSGRIEAYIITARHSSYKKEFDQSIKRLLTKAPFVQAFYNENDLEPFSFKNDMFQKLNLDFYIDDNLDVVTEMAKKHPGKILWLTNFFDKNIEYPDKFFSLTQIADKFMKL